MPLPTVGRVQLLSASARPDIASDEEYPIINKGKIITHIKKSSLSISFICTRPGLDTN